MRYQFPLGRCVTYIIIAGKVLGAMQMEDINVVIVEVGLFH